MSSVNENIDTDQVIDFFDPTIVHDKVLVVEEQKFHVQSEYLVESEFFQNLFDSEVQHTVEKKPKKTFFGSLSRGTKAPANIKVDEVELKNLSLVEFGPKNLSDSDVQNTVEQKPKKTFFASLTRCVKAPVELKVDEADLKDVSVEEKKDSETQHTLEKKSKKSFFGSLSRRKAPADIKVDEYELKDISAEEFGDFLKLIYPGQFEINGNNFKSLTVQSVMFGFPSAEAMCIDFIRNNFAELEINDLIELANKFDLSDAKFMKFWAGCFKDLSDVDLKQLEMQLKKVSMDQFQDFLKFVHDDEFELKGTTYKTMMSLSFVFGSPKAFDKCHEWIRQNFEDLGIINMIEMALKFKLDDVKIMCFNVIAEDNPDKGQYSQWDEQFDGCSCVVCIKESLKVAYGFPFNHNSFVSKNKAKILSASAEAKAFILSSIIQTKF